MAFLLWLACLLGACGIHRFYLGKPLSGLLYLLTFGIFGIGQIIDLFLMRDLVLAANAKSNRFSQVTPARLLSPARPKAASKEELRIKLVRAACGHGGKLSVSQGVMATGRSFKEIESLLDEMAKSGFVGIDNDPQTGAVVYTFDEL
jgi:TM2 domain-containing membrane protein YozV